ncbi:hypothetical protein [Embleya sp. NPDC059237]|uniref:hypothetical protein n=1 Tax=Embleya sp. NPDC059237 TaxID=3346784 RepID=UPI0036787133
MDEDAAATAAAAELRRRLEDALAQSRKTKTQLAGITGLARTTVSEAFRPGKLPSAETTAALARALGLDVPAMLDLRRRATAPAPRDVEEDDRPIGPWHPDEPTAPRDAEEDDWPIGPWQLHEPAVPRDRGVGRPIEAWHPHDLEVHPAGTPRMTGRSGRDDAALPGYVERAHDRALAETVRAVAAGRSALVVLVGSSSTGKTRACWEAVQPLADRGWWLWHPSDPTRAEAALADLARVGPRTVVWLNEAQHYLGDPRAGERVAAAVHTLLTDADRGPVLVLGTLWPEYAREYTRLPRPGETDPYSRVRELLSGRTLAVPDAFDDAALRTATALAEAGDRHLADTLARTRDDGRVAQDLAGAPELLRRHTEGTEPERALLHAAMDARRLGLGPHLPWAFLVDAATDYLDDHTWDALPEDWAETALDELAHPGLGTHAPLRRAGRPRRRASPPPGSPAPPPASGGPVYRLADYLEQHGRHERLRVCPPASFWETAALTATPEELRSLARAATERGRHRHAALLTRRIADTGDTHALFVLAEMREEAGDPDGAERLYREAADTGSTHALFVLARMREEAGDPDGAERLYREAADTGSTHALLCLAEMRGKAGDSDGAEHLYRQALDAGETHALLGLAEMRGKAGDSDGAEHLYRQAADTGEAYMLLCLARVRKEAGDLDRAEHLYRRAADAGDTQALLCLAGMRQEAGDRYGAEVLSRQADSALDTTAMMRILEMWEAAGDRDNAERFAREVALAGNTSLLLHLAGKLEWSENPHDAERLYQQAIDAGDTGALTRLGVLREEAGDPDGAERLYRQAIDAGDTSGLNHLGSMRNKAGDPDGAERLYRQAIDAGDPHALEGLVWMLNEAARDALERTCPENTDTGNTDTWPFRPWAWNEQGNPDYVESLCREAADAGDISGLRLLAGLRHAAGDEDAAERLYREAADAGDTVALLRLARMREEAGDLDGVERLYREAADAGDPRGVKALARLSAQRSRYGWEPDGSISPPW